jgi:hypothetical protein
MPWGSLPMSAEGQSRRFRDVRDSSALKAEPHSRSVKALVADVPRPDPCDAAEWGALSPSVRAILSRMRFFVLSCKQRRRSSFDQIAAFCHAKLLPDHNQGLAVRSTCSGSVSRSCRWSSASTGWERRAWRLLVVCGRRPPSVSNERMPPQSCWRPGRQMVIRGDQHGSRSMLSNLLPNEQKRVGKERDGERRERLFTKRDLS